MRCDYCDRTDGRPSNTKVVGGGFRTVILHATWGVESPDWECNLKARRGYPRGYREPITDSERAAMTNYKTYGPKGWTWGADGREWDEGYGEY